LFAVDYPKDGFMSYRAPVKDMMFSLQHLAGFDAMVQWPGLSDLDLATAEAVLEENAKFMESVVAPLNARGDQQPARFHHGEVTTTPGFKEAFAQFAQAGWQGLQHPAAFGGQGLPKIIAAPCLEMLNSGSVSLALCPLLTDGAIEALLIAGTPQQQKLYLPKMVSGEWTGTMNLTEPQAGSDLALVRTRAEPQADGTYKLFGTKIYITYGEHDMARNIVHFVLARVPGAPEGVKGLSLFIVPKYVVQADGSVGPRNDVHCVSLEHKLGIHGSPTAVMQYGDHGGAVGDLMGEPGRGLEYMFIMMNAARYAVGLQGIGLAERAYQHAVAYARERVQSRPVDGSVRHSVPIIKHPDVRRMLLCMRAHTQGCRAMAIVAAAAFDGARHHPDASVRADQQAFFEFLVPLVKGYSTEMSIEVASLAVQVHGGMGFIEETGVAQYYRDARVLSIYEGTTAIQANDLVGRKTLRDGGAVARDIASLMEATEHAVDALAHEAATRLARHLHTARAAWLEVVGFVLQQGSSDPNAVFAGSVPYLMLSGQVVAGWQLARGYVAAQNELDAGRGDAEFLRAKQATALFYGDHILSRSVAWRSAIVEGASSVMGLEEAAF
jgi:3-(methylthio)propanoyl-CoA dehydrogenase